MPLQWAIVIEAKVWLPRNSWGNQDMEVKQEDGSQSPRQRLPPVKLLHSALSAVANNMLALTEKW